MTCTRKKDKARIVKNHHPTIKRIPDELWNEIKKVLLKEKPSKTVGRPIVKYRRVLEGILYVLRTGYQWKMLPKEYHDDISAFEGNQVRIVIDDDF
ncbi:MAG: transposase [Candidatus Nitrosocosmicus sp.]|nr:transposase [Candidatus Nitrosocosmicus sp.]MDN5869042.1 transposase [Candidatus Nitrosocosmicus sp.]